MSKTFTGARPVRFSRGEGWIECQPHQAQRWQPVLAGRVLCPAPYKRNKAAALDLLAANVASKRPLPRSYRLGSNMQPSGAGSIASSLTRAQYDRSQGNG